MKEKEFFIRAVLRNLEFATQCPFAPACGRVSINEVYMNSTLVKSINYPINRVKFLRFSTPTDGRGLVGEGILNNYLYNCDLV